MNETENNSADNTSFIESSKFCKFDYYHYSSGNSWWECTSSNASKWGYNLITAQSLLENKWIFSQFSFKSPASEKPLVFDSFSHSEKLQDFDIESNNSLTV